MGSCLSTTAKTNVFDVPVLFEISPVAHVFEIFHVALILIEIVSLLFKISPGPFYEVPMPGAVSTHAGGEYVTCRRL